METVIRAGKDLFGILALCLDNSLRTGFEVKKHLKLCKPDFNNAELRKRVIVGKCRYFFSRASAFLTGRSPASEMMSGKS